ncbi:hypothetical protein EMPS_07483 [Entomortierella parvispora]|uniref:Uncharacterized protein n=1 Tax=Entomortierella parvispora TaxID=205924 RepID=A0A9P3HEK1_9FUNG|nr:hypothetical protein EMPS_07483 [Entomortierella parvispora]
MVRPKKRDSMWAKEDQGLHTLFSSTRIDHRASNRTIHLELATQLLRRCLSRRDYGRAFKIYRIIVDRPGIHEEMVWKIGSELLMNSKDYEPQCVRFMQLIFAKSKECRQHILLELALYQMRCGKFEDAHTTLEPYVNIWPYNENAVIQGYAGMVEYALWKKALRQKQMTDRDQDRQDGQDVDMRDENHRLNSVRSDDLDEWSDGESDPVDQDAVILTGSISRYANTAQALLERALKQNPENDMFLTYLVRIRCGKIGPEGLGSASRMSRTRRLAIHETRLFLKKFLDRNKESLLCLQLLAALENRERLKTLEMIVNIDPAADWNLYIQPLLKLSRLELPLDQRVIIRNIVDGIVVTKPRLAERSLYSVRETDIIPLETVDKRLGRREMPYLKDMSQVTRHKNVKVDKGKKKKNGDDQEDVDDGDEDEDQVNGKKQSRKDRKGQRWDVSHLEGLRTHQPDVKYFRASLQILLRRAEYGLTTDAEEAEIIRISSLFCFCSLYCRRVQDMAESQEQAQRKISCLQDLPEKRQPPWLKRVAMILSRIDEY